MVKIYLFLLAFIFSFPAFSQQRQLVGGPCEGCDAVFEYGDRVLNATDTLPKFAASEPKMKLTGTVYQPDGTTPASGVILYVYHTNREGIYETRGDETGWARRHGYIRGWVKTDEMGRYTFYTFRPAAYPSRSEPEHVHITVLEPDGKYYWLHSFLFSDDPLLTEKEKKKTSRGGEGRIQTLRMEDDILVGGWDIILGKNIPGYQ